MTVDRRLLAEFERLDAERQRRLAKANPLALSPQKPTPKQQEFLNLTCFEALFGGSAGGGKSSTLLMAALQYAHVPGYAALILRRTYADLALPGAIMDRAKDWLIPNGVRWHDTDKRFTFASGATLTFGYLDNDRDRYRYQGAELQFIAFDELTQFPEQWYRYLLSRLRRLKTSEVPIRVRSASNPGGIGHDWVRRRFMDDAEGRAFVPSSLADNPFIDRAEYESTLANLDSVTRRQLLDGVWVRDSGGLVYQYDEKRNGLDKAPDDLEFYLLALDYGVVDATAFTVLGWRSNDPTVYVVESYKRTKMSPSEAAIEVLALSERYAFVQMVADVGGLGKAFAEEARRRFSLPIEPAEKNNKRGYQALMNDAFGNGQIRVVRSGCKPLIDEWHELPWTEDRTKECDGFDNHCADSALYGWRACNAYPERAQAPKPVMGTAEYAEAERQKLIEYLESEQAKAADPMGLYFDD